VIREVIIRNDPTNDLVLMCLEKGTRPHRIPTTGNKILHFEIGGEEVFAQNVYHKGSKAFGMVDITRQALQARIGDTMRQVLEKFAQRVTGGGESV